MRDAIDVYRHAYVERMADWKTNEEQLAAAAAVIEADREQVRLEQLEEIEVLRAHVGYWVEEARLYAQNADYWRTKCEANNAKLREALISMRQAAAGFALAVREIDKDGDYPWPKLYAADAQAYAALQD